MLNITSGLLVHWELTNLRQYPETTYILTKTNIKNNYDASGIIYYFQENFSSISSNFRH